MLKNLLSIIQEAGEKMLAYDKPKVYQKEGHANYVTQADIEVQAFLMDRLSQAMPEAGFFAEERENEAFGTGPVFVIDPIDGTTNFMRGRSCSSISVALLRDRVPVLGAVLNPYRKELFHAEKGRGAYLNGAPIHPSDMPMEKALVNMGTSPYNALLAGRSMEAAKAFLREASDIRRTGSAAIDLCEVACGRSDIYWELELSPWDYAAGSLIAAEAGAQVGCPGKGMLSYERKMAVLAANPLCFKRAEELLLSV